MKNIILFLTILGGMTIACSDDDKVNTTPCTDEFVPALVATVTNAATGAPITTGITLTATEGDYIDQFVLLTPTNQFSAAGERAGTYTITVTGNGYEPYVSEAITVTRDDCHVITQNVNVALTPAP